MVGRQGNVILVNGHADPVAQLPAGGLHRMRFVNAANARYFKLSLGEDFWILGFDGAKLERPVRVSESLLVPGARVDVAFAGKAGGETLGWHALSYERGHDTGGSPDSKLFNVAFSGDASADVSLPQAFAELPLLAEPAATKMLALEESTPVGGPHAGHGGGGDAAPVFSINGEVFPDVQPLSAVLGSTEEWTVSNTTEMDHPFHLHGFRFEIIDVDGSPPAFRALQDTINVGAMQIVTLRVPLEGHPGTWMFHCHILEHAERGMMGELSVVEP
jgi:FtsP/CotA-like multicopper oxidase with cupredoxin domain